MSREYSFVDATRPLTLHVTWEDIKGGVPGDGRNCVLSRAGRREHNCFDILVHRTVAYVRKSERSVPVRYQVTESAKDALVAFDASGRSRPITVTFVPPRRAISSKYLRSPERKKVEKLSKERRKKREQVGGRRRMYTKPDPLTLFGVRNGSGVRPLGSGKLR